MLYLKTNRNLTSKVVKTEVKSICFVCFFYFSIHNTEKEGERDRQDYDDEPKLIKMEK